MHLVDFDGYFHLFAAFNFAYVVSKDFRMLINFIVLERMRKGVEHLVLLTNALTLNNKEDYQLEAKEFYARTDELQKGHEESAKMGGILQILFMYSGFFCIAVLLLAGYEQFMHVTDAEIAYAGNNCYPIPECTAINNTLFVLNITSVLFALFTFGFYYFFPNHFIDIYVPILLLLAVLLAMGLIFHFDPYRKSCDHILLPKVNITIAIIITWLPFAFHYLKILRVNFIVYNPARKKLEHDIRFFLNGIKFTIQHQDNSKKDTDS